MSITALKDVPLPGSADPRLHGLLAYWNERRGALPYPARADIDPVDIPGFLPHLSLVEVRPGSPRFVYRLMGTKLVELMKKELTGQPVGTGVKPDEIEAVLARYRRVADEGIALYHRHRMQELANDYTGVDRLMLPIGKAGAPVNMILSIVVPRLKGKDAEIQRAFAEPRS
ncbi:MAG: PAS domain-containing protein [Proteobacteria bacterium]|nr:PAS domain-containing protein [Pseudomonadota bacterium]